MSVVKKVAKFVTGGAVGLAMNLLGGKPKKGPVAPGPAAQDDAAEMAEREDELRRRRGAAADMITGTGGAEGGGGAKFVAGN